MHIKKQRLLTPGPTPLYPPALRAMMASDMHHRTEDFRKVYKSVLNGLKETLHTRNDVIVLVGSGSAAMEAAIQNCFSAGEEVLVCDRNKPVARIVPCRLTDHSEQEQRLVARGILTLPLKKRPTSVSWPEPPGNVSDEVMEQVRREERESR